MTDDAISPALVAALGSFDELVRDKTANVAMKSGGQYSYSYSDLASVLGYVRPILAAHGLAVMQPVTSDGATVSVATIILHQSGQERAFPPLSMPCGRTPQEVGSAITYAKRYALLSVLGLATEDDDGAAANKAARAAPKRAVTQPKPVGQPADTAAAGRRRHAMALLGELGLSGDNNRDERLRLTADLAGRQHVDSWNDLTGDEQDQVIDQLKLRVEASRVPQP